MSNRIEKNIEMKAPLERVWRALTDYEEFGQWFGVKLDGPFVAGEISTGRMTIDGCGNQIWRAEIVEIRPMDYFAYRWHPGAPGPDFDYSSEPQTLVEFRLEATAGGTRLTVTETGFDALPDHYRQDAMRMNEGGWDFQMKNIAAHVA